MDNGQACRPVPSRPAAAGFQLAQAQEGEDGQHDDDETDDVDDVVHGETPVTAKANGSA